MQYTPPPTTLLVSYELTADKKLINVNVCTMQMHGAVHAYTCSDKLIGIFDVHVWQQASLWNQMRG